MFLRYNYFILNWIKKCNGKRFYVQSGSWDSSNFVLSKSMFSFSGVNDGYYSESYGPGFVEALKGDRMSLYS
jgi:hypothetical protein